MGTTYLRAPHYEGAAASGAHAPNAALLIDFDNVTMGMRSDLAKELKSLLDSDIIKGKVTVQRAYADWRRYPQYIVPLSEASIDLIFAPAYGSSKKNATDIRMAIDGMELIFIRPEIGTFILLTGDSDFSSLVLKLKEYGKYVIGIGIQESSSDILVQNCDEYYSYTSIAGLKKTTDLEHTPLDPWATVEQALERMVSRGDVMRSDRLKQVMLEIDPGFDEKGYGFSKFSKFLAEASSRKLVQLKKLENGQYEVAPPQGAPPQDRMDGGRGRRSDGRRSRRDHEERRPRKTERPANGDSQRTPPPRAEAGDPLEQAYELLRRALEAFRANGKDPVRDSDVKRKMLELDGAFDETELGFPKFSRFLTMADEQGVVVLDRRDTGNFEVTIGTGTPRTEAEAAGASADAAVPPQPDLPAPKSEPQAQGGLRAGGPPANRTVTPRRGSGGPRRSGEGLPPLFEGQVVGAKGHARSDGDPSSIDPSSMGLPTDTDAMIRYMSSRYKGVGHKTAEALVHELGDELFAVMHADPDRVRSIVPSSRADQVLLAWRADYERRAGSPSEDPRNGEAELAASGTASADPAPSESGGARRRTRRGTRRGARGRGTSNG